MPHQAMRASKRGVASCWSFLGVGEKTAEGASGKVSGRFHRFNERVVKMSCAAAFAREEPLIGHLLASPSFTDTVGNAACSH